MASEASEVTYRSGDGFRWEQAGPIGTLTLDRPGTGNALSRAQFFGLRQLWSDLSANRSLRCLIVVGEGDRFCTGGSVSGLAGDRLPLGVGVEDELFWLPGRSLEIPVIAAVNGVCASAGLHFVADADIVIASETAWFVDTHVNVGQVSGIEPSSLALRLPMAQLGKLALTGRAGRLDAQQALMFGLICEITKPEALMDRARELAAAVAAASPEAVRQTRRVLRRIEQNLLLPFMSAGFDALVAHWSHPDCNEGAVAWSEKREPRWSEVSTA